MSIWVIELNDSEIRVSRDAKIIHRSPGYAVIRNDLIQTGVDAVKQAYLNPRETYNRFWDKLNQDALQTPAGNYRHHADLAYAHLTSIHDKCGKPGEFIFAVPGGYTREQLALLLGIVQACPFKAIGLVDSAVAAAAAVVDYGQYQYLDIQLHKSVITQLDAGRQQVTRGKVDVVDDSGLIKIYTTVSALIADLFIQQSRFDPHHRAETEQALYDQLPRCLQTLNSGGEVMLEIQYKNTTYQAKMHREELLNCLKPIYDRISGRLSPDRTVLLGDRLNILPGLTDIFAAAKLLAPETVFRGCVEHQTHISSQGPALEHVTTLPVTNDPSVTAIRDAVELEQRKTPTLSERVTHVLSGNSAQRLNAGKTWLTAGGDISTTREQDSRCYVTSDAGRVILSAENGHNVYLNGKEVNGSSEIHPGDRVGFSNSGTVFTFISVN